MTNKNDDTPFGNPNAPDDEVFELPEDLDEDLQEDPNEKWRMDEGEYRARVVDLEAGTSKSGNAMWTWTFAVVAGKYEGRELKLWTALTPKAMFKLREVVQALGVWKPGEKLKIKPSDIMNREAVIHVTEDEYNGRVSAKIDSVSALDDGSSADAGSGSPGDDDIPF